MQVNASYSGTIMCCDVGLLSLPKACDYGRCVLTAVTACTFWQYTALYKGYQEASYNPMKDN